MICVDLKGEQLDKGSDPFGFVALAGLYFGHLWGHILENRHCGRFFLICPDAKTILRLGLS